MISTDPPAMLTSEHVHRLIRDWTAALARSGPPAELLQHLANGLLLKLPGHTVRGAHEFERWYREQRGRAGAAALLSDAAASRFDVRIATPVHAEVTVSPGLPYQVPQSWWVVLRDGAPRIRTISLRRWTAAPQPATAQPVHAARLAMSAESAPVARVLSNV